MLNVELVCLFVFFFSLALCGLLVSIYHDYYEKKTKKTIHWVGLDWIGPSRKEKKTLSIMTENARVQARWLLLRVGLYGCVCEITGIELSSRCGRRTAKRV